MQTIHFSETPSIRTNRNLFNVEAIPSQSECVFVFYLPHSAPYFLPAPLQNRTGLRGLIKKKHHAQKSTSMKQRQGSSSDLHPSLILEYSKGAGV
jgi:hypothetical protein